MQMERRAHHKPRYGSQVCVEIVMLAGWGLGPGAAALQGCFISVGAAPSASSCFIHVPVGSATSSAGGFSSQWHLKEKYSAH